MMKREIFFRGKRTDNGEWVSSGNLITFNDEGDGKQFFIPQMNEKCTCTHDEQDNIISFDSGMFYKVDPDTVGQFTGLTDKNGKKIFDGDILKAIAGNPVGEPIVAKVVPNLNDYELMWDIEHSYELEIIGNIHDNPELLGGTGDGN